MSTPDTNFYDDWKDWADAFVADVDERLAQFGAKEKTGRLVIFRGTAVDTGYLACNGATFVAASFPSLANFLGGNVLPDYTSPFVNSVVGIKT